MKENPPVLSKPSLRFEETKTARWLCWPFKPTPFLVKFSIVASILGLIIVAAVFFSFVIGQVNFPFKVDYRKALTGSSYVAQIVNTSDKVQSVKATFHNPTFNRTKVYTLIVNAHQLREIGYLEGWAASSGDTVTLECKGVSKKFYLP
jgi:hypothetical protein